MSLRSLLPPTRGRQIPNRNSANGPVNAHKPEKPHRMVLFQDHPLMALGTRSFLSREPDLEICAVLTEPDTALQQVPLDLPDLALFELNLVGPYDFNYLRRLRKQYPSMPVLIYSYHEEVFFAHRTFEAGASGYLMKHEPPEALIEAVRTVLDGKQYRSPRMTAKARAERIDCETGQSRIHELSNRELQVLQCLGEELRIDEIARNLRVRPSTLQGHMRKIARKFGLQNTEELTSCARHWTYFDSQFA